MRIVTLALVLLSLQLSFGTRAERLVQVGDIVKIESGSTLVLAGPSHLKVDSHALMTWPKPIIISLEEKERLEASKWLVVSAKMGGGGHGMGGNDYYPDGLLIEAIQLDQNDQVIEGGFKISFSQTGAFSTNVKRIKILGSRGLLKGNNW